MKPVSLRQKAVLVDFSARLWAARKYDKVASVVVEKEFKTKQGAGRYNKILIALDEIEVIQKIVTQARQYHYSVTCPWFQEGTAILNVCKIEEYSEKMREYKDKFESAVKEFLPKYPLLIEQAKEAQSGLGKLWKQNDYPSVSGIGEKFSFCWNFYPLPNENDFRIDALHDGQIKELQTSLEANYRQANSVIAESLWSRLLEAIVHLKEQINEVDDISKQVDRKRRKPLHKSLVRNIKSIVDTLPFLNVIDDPKIEELRKKTEIALSDIDIDDLKADKAMREFTVMQAKQLETEIRMVMKPGVVEVKEEQKPKPVESVDSVLETMTAF